MICGDDHSAALRDIFDAVKFNLPKQTAEEADNRPQYVQQPLRKDQPALSWLGLRSLNRKCAVVAQVNLYVLRRILQRPSLQKNARSAYTKLLILLEFSPLLRLPTTPEKG